MVGQVEIAWRTFFVLRKCPKQKSRKNNEKSAQSS